MRSLFGKAERFFIDIDPVLRKRASPRLDVGGLSTLVLPAHTSFGICTSVRKTNADKMCFGSLVDTWPVGLGCRSGYVAP